MIVGRAIIFDDIYSVIHFLAGALSSMLNLEVPMSILYAFYEFVERKEPRPFKLGDIVEFALGMFVGKFVKCVILGWW